MLLKCKTNVFLFFILCHMSLEFLLENMCKTCVFYTFKNKRICQNMCQKPINIYLKACINAYVNLFVKTYVKHAKDYMLSLQLQWIIEFNEFLKKLKWNKK
jgi:hypothetical protein